jgi:hypothetical protein
LEKSILTGEDDPSFITIISKFGYCCSYMQFIVPIKFSSFSLKNGIIIEMGRGLHLKLLIFLFFIKKINELMAWKENRKLASIEKMIMKSIAHLSYYYLIFF